MENKTPVTQQQLVNDWARIAVERFREAMKKENVHIGALFESFVYNVVAGSEGNVQLAQLRFKFYGRFVDMGVGRGFPIGSRRGIGSSKFLERRNAKGQLRRVGRKPKKIYARPLAGQVKRLNELLADNFKITAITALENSLEQASIEIKI